MVIIQKKGFPMKTKRLSSLSVIIVLCAIVLTVSCSSFAFANTGNGDKLSQSEINARFDQINSSYAVGEEFTAEDAAFVLEYGKSPQEMMLRQSQGFSVSGGGYGTNLNAYGSVWHNGVFNYNWGGQITATKTSGGTPRSITGSVNCTSYGIVGSGGIGLVYDETIYHSSSYSNSLYMNKGANYSGLGITFYVTARVDVTTAEGYGFSFRCI